MENNQEAKEDTMDHLFDYEASSGHLVPVWTIEIQTLPEEVDRILDAVMSVHPLSFGRYNRNASISAVGKETSQPAAASTAATHEAGFTAGSTETYPMVELKISIERDLKILSSVMDTIIYTHHYEEPVIFVREDWASRAAYDPQSKNPNRWWNNARGLPDRIDTASQAGATGERVVLGPCGSGLRQK
ncbi:hypothetical protein SAMN04515647_1408 [Cohaesibacter sp. ES.047]|uniref:hypothetical protein n=1 Tax=Cohaesibacter sp. ES.047 TaxID=1798205 RepID=UPI000BBF5F4E|nr:hypothetical protein [Cohaesibacter sp. ES.047]SNY91195.1 hypothetical protein SAMN04515647_1408 [Cohaesibacter sp. ES.047]